MSERAESGTIPVVILAGGKAKPELQAVTGQEKRALAVVEGKTLLMHVVDALQAASQIGVLTVVGEMPAHPAYRTLPDAGDFVANVFAGLTAHQEAPYVLVATSDLPFLTGAGVADFVHGALELAWDSDADLVWPIVPVADCYRQYPGIKRTALKLREGRYTGGNLMLARPAFVLAHQKRLAESFAARKSVSRLAGILGLGTLGRLLLSQTLAPRLLTIPLLEARVSRLLGGHARAYISNYPEIATDLDRPSDFVALSAGRTVAS